MRNLLSGLVSGAGLVVLWAVLTQKRPRSAYRPITRIRKDLRESTASKIINYDYPTGAVTMRALIDQEATDFMDHICEHQRQCSGC